MGIETCTYTYILGRDAAAAAASQVGGHVTVIDLLYARSGPRYEKFTDRRSYKRLVRVE